MTVRRSQSEVFAALAERVRAALDDVLEHPPSGYRYVDTRRENSGNRIRTTLRPRLWPLLLKTPLIIDVSPLDPPNLSKVVVRIESQAFLYGDVFGFYLRYIDHLLGELRRELGEAD